jgi:hypothetical protein
MVEKMRDKKRKKIVKRERGRNEEKKKMEEKGAKNKAEKGKTLEKLLKIKEMYSSRVGNSR